MPIISADKFQYFRPTIQTENVQGGFGAPGLPQVSQAASAANTQAGRQLAGQIQEWGRGIQERIIKEEVTQHTFSALAELTEAEIEVQQDPDHRSMPDRFQERVKGIYDAHVQAIKSDTAKQLFEQKFGAYSTNQANRVQWKTYEREVGAQQASVATAESNALLRMSFSDSLSEIATITQEFENDLQDKVRHGIITEEWAQQASAGFRKKSGMLSVRTHMAADPEGALTLLSSDQWATYYPGLDPLARIQQMEAAETRVEQVEAQRIADQERQEREAEERTKELQSATYYDFQLALSQGRLTREMFESALQDRALPEGKIDMLREELDAQEKGEAVEEDPYVKARLASDVALGRDVRMDLDQALENGTINSQTYVRLRETAASDEMSKAFQYVNNAIKPSDLEPYHADRNVRHAKAVDEVYERIEIGKSPYVAAKEVIDIFLQDIKRTIKGIPRPMLLQGEKTDMQALNTAESETVRHYQEGRMHPRTYQRQLDRINELKKLVREQEEGSTEIKEIEKDSGRSKVISEANQ